MSSKNDTKRFLVIGSNSFSGSHFVKGLIEKGFKVWGLSRSKEPNKVFLPYFWDAQKLYKIKDKCEQFNFRSLDLNKDIKEIINFIDDIQPEYIVNFAAQGMVAESWKNPVHWYKTNIISQFPKNGSVGQTTMLIRFVSKFCVEPRSPFSNIFHHDPKPI